MKVNRPSEYYSDKFVSRIPVVFAFAFIGVCFNFIPKRIFFKSFLLMFLDGLTALILVALVGQWLIL